MNQNNGKDRNVAVIDLVEDDPQQNQTAGAFSDSDNLELKPATSVEAGNKKSWKRRLVSWALVLLLVFGGAVALYLLLKVNRVAVKVDADSRRDSQSAKPNPNSSNPDNNLTAEAINIARAASGADPANPQNPKPSGSPNASSPTPTPSPEANVRTNYSFTGNSSPVFDPVNDGASNGNGNQQQNGSANQQQEKSGNLTAPAVMQNHANATQSIVVEDAPAKAVTPALTTAGTQLQSRIENKTSLVSPPKTPPAVLPPFGTMLPVRTQGVIFTLRNNSYARLELTRDSAGTGWSLPKGTVLVGRTTGSEYDRAFVNVIGYIDPRDNKLVKMSGDVLGNDGATGIPGKRIGVDRSRLKQTLRKVASSGVQVAGLLGGALGRGTVILDRSGYPIPDDIRGVGTGRDEKNAFVKVEAGQQAYVMVADLPKATQAIDAPGDDELARAATSLADREVMELILFGSPDEIRAAMPLMSDEQKRLAVKTLAPENKEK
jgi:hypothetical protein